MKLKYEVVDNKYLNIKEVLKNHFQISDRLLIKLKKNNKIFLNGSQAFVYSTLKLKDIVLIDIDFDEESENIIPKKIDFEIIFEDETMLIVNKSPNLPVHPSLLHFEDSLSNGVKYYFESKKIHTKIRPVNRLDKDTSGIVIFAKNEYIQEALIKQMKQNTFKKEYIAILKGTISDEKITISAPISRKKDSIIEREISENGQKAISYLTLLKNFEINNQKLSLVKFELETGRTHQLRVHSKYIGHPILGDTLYGKQSDLIKRQALHAFKVSFLHPITKEKIVLKTDIPKDFVLK